jgi:hypothetical protein
MSRQINFLAGPEDLEQFHSWLMATFPEMSTVPWKADSEGARRVLSSAQTASSLGHMSLVLVPSWAVDKLVFRPSGSKVTVDLYSSPVLEYSPPSVDDSSNSLKVGRIYWAFTDSLEPQQQRDIDSIFNWIRSRSTPKEAGSSFRIFPSAMKFQILRGWAGETISKEHKEDAARKDGMS